MQIQKIATIFGGSGFIGSQIVRVLAARGYIVKVAARVPERAYELRTCGAVGQVVPVACNYRDASSIEAVVSGADVVINCVGTFNQRGGNKFTRIYGDIPAMIAQACAGAKVERFIHISGLGVDMGHSRYAKAKLEGEEAVLQAFPQAVILRPGVVFGPGDDFFNKFAELSRFTPVLPLIGGGKTRMQPVYVGDIAEAVLRIITFEGLRVDPRGQIFQLGGPEVLTFREIYQSLFKHTERPRALVYVPFWGMKIKAAFLSLLPSPIMTPDQVEMLKTDSVVADGALTFADLGMSPAAMAMILPSYLDTYRAGGRFAHKKKA